MTKKGPLGRAEKFYIQNKYVDTPVDVLCKDLDRAKSLVSKEVLKCKTAAKKFFRDDQLNEPVSEQETSQNFPSRDGVTMISQTGSQLGDLIVSPRGNRARPDCVTSTKKNG